MKTTNQNRILIIKQTTTITTKNTKGHYVYPIAAQSPGSVLAPHPAHLMFCRLSTTLRLKTEKKTAFREVKMEGNTCC